jgi:hypothetical protein
MRRASIRSGSLVAILLLLLLTLPLAAIAQTPVPTDLATKAAAAAVVINGADAAGVLLGSTRGFSLKRGLVLAEFRPLKHAISGVAVQSSTRLLGSHGPKNNKKPMSAHFGRGGAGASPPS